MNTPDRELLSTYLAGGPPAHDAFRTLTTRYVGLIYATAKRQAPPHLVEDITQAVFLLLAQKAKAKSLRNPELLPAWLLTTTRFCAAAARRQESRRHRREQEVAAMTPLQSPPDSDDLDALAPHLDTALLSLSSPDRTAILLRYYNNQPLAEIAHALNISEEAAKKRLSRALEKLRKLFLKKHLPLAAPALAATLAKQATAAPAHLATHCAALALTPATASTTVTLLANATAKTVAASTAKLTALATAALLLLTLAITQLLANHHPPTPAPTIPIAASPPPAPPASRPQPDPAPAIQVLDMDTHLPIPAAHIECSAGSLGQGPSLSTDTAPDGTARIPLPPTVADELQITVRKEGYVPAVAHEGSGFPGDPLPFALTIQLEKATTIGGRVLDQNNTPLPNATVDVTLDKFYPNLPQQIPVHLQTTTNAQGEWTLNAAPVNCNSIKVGAYHPACESPGFIIATEIPIPALRNRSAITTLHRAAPLHALVRGPDNKPLKASVILNDGRLAPHAVPPFPTSDDGQFDFVPTNDPLSLLISAPNCASQVVQYSPNTPQPLTIHLEPATPLTLRIVDANAHPIPNALIVIDNWQNPGGHRSYVDKVFISDANGEASWPEAVSATLLVNITARGLLTQKDVSVYPGSPNEITMLPQFTVHATVLDDATGKPAANFRAALGTFTPFNHKFLDYTDQPTWQTLHIRHTGPGTFDFADTTQHDSFVLRILGGGYEPANSEILTTDGRDQSITIHVHKGRPLAGTLLDLAGKPLPKTYVYAQTTTLYIDDGFLPDKPVTLDWYNDADRFSLTDSAGNFSLSPQQGECNLIASNATGYAIVPAKSFLDTHTLQLTPWARIDGTFLLNGRPVPNATIQADLTLPNFQNRIGPICQYKTTTDPNGHFSLPKLIAGPYTLHARLENTNHDQTTTSLEALPGETATVTLNP